MKIYTKTGDNGETGLLAGIRVSKSHLAIEACGSLDETNSFIGLARSAFEGQTLLADVNDCLGQIQNDLFDLGSQIAASLGNSERAPEFPESRGKELESQIDKFEAELEPLKAFILPGGSRPGSLLHLARSVCRRSERHVVALIDSGVQRSLTNEMIYLNRLGDLLFVIARVANSRLEHPETTWNVGREGK